MVVDDRQQFYVRQNECAVSPSDALTDRLFVAGHKQCWIMKLHR